MKKMLLFALAGLIGCAGLNDPYYSGNQYDYNYDRGYDHSRRHDSYYQRRERERLERERRELERERERLARERERRRREREQMTHRPRPQPQKPKVGCPPGFRPGRCSKKDRKHGCKDMRTSSGLGCRS